MFIHFFISHILHTDAVPGAVLSTGKQRQWKPNAKSNGFLSVKISHRYFIYLGRKTSFPALPFRAPPSSGTPQIPSPVPTTHLRHRNTLYSLSTNTYVREESASESPAVPSACFQIPRSFPPFLKSFFFLLLFISR